MLVVGVGDCECVGRERLQNARVTDHVVCDVAVVERDWLIETIEFDR